MSNREIFKADPNAGYLVIPISVLVERLKSLEAAKERFCGFKLKSKAVVTEEATLTKLLQDNLTIPGSHVNKAISDYELDCNKPKRPSATKSRQSRKGSNK